MTGDEGDGGAGGAGGGGRGNKPMTNADFRALLSAPRPDARQQNQQQKKKDKGQRRPQRPSRDGDAGPKYRDRAAERRKGINPDYDGIELGALGAAAAAASAGAGGATPAPPRPAFVASAAAAASGREQVALTAEETKFLGGDVEHTHLVRGLDYALLQKMRREEKEKEKERKTSERGGDEGDVDVEGEAAAERLPTPKTELGRAALSFLLQQEGEADGSRERKDTRRAAESFLPKRTVYLFDVGRGGSGGDDESVDGDGEGDGRRRRPSPVRGLGFPLEPGAPTTLVRAAADCPRPRALVSSAELEGGGGEGRGKESDGGGRGLLDRLAKIMLYVSGGASGGGGKKSKRKGGGKGKGVPAAAPFSLFGDVDGVGQEMTVDAATAAAVAGAKAAAAAAPVPPPEAAAATAVDADDDIFADAGRDYEPTVVGAVAGPALPRPPEGFDAEGAYGPADAYPTAEELEEEQRERGADGEEKKKPASVAVRRRADGVGDRAARRTAVAPGGLEADDEDDAYAELYPGMAGFGREAYSDSEGEGEGEKRELPDPEADGAGGGEAKRRKKGKPDKEERRLDSDLGKIREILENERGADVAGAFGDKKKRGGGDDDDEAALAAAASKRRRRLG